MVSAAPPKNASRLSVRWSFRPVKRFHVAGRMRAGTVCNLHRNQLTIAPKITRARHNSFMRRGLIVTFMVLLVVLAATVHVSHHSLGWGSYWGVDFVAPWHR